MVSKKLTALIVAGTFSLSVMPLVATSSIAQAEPAGSMSNAPPNGKVDMSKQPDKTVVKQPATSADKKMKESKSSPAK